jgi:hypothetical protein
MAPTNVANPTRAFIPIKQTIIAIRLDWRVSTIKRMEEIE